MMEKEAQQLLIKYHTGQCTDAEKALVERWLFSFNQDVPSGISLERIAKLKALVRQQLPLPERQFKNKFKPFYWNWISAAAILVIISCLGLYFMLETSGLNTNGVEFSHDIPPGGHSAVLTLASGKTIELSKTSSEVIINGGQLSYSDGKVIESKDIDTAIRTISTPRGGQYSIQLPDGSTVLLNAASTLKFPASFQGLAKRKVKLYGEAYFEISKDKKHPFLVETEKQSVEVLGTHFNINAYKDEQSIKTTLLEGSVKVGEAGIGYRILKPGEQAVNTGAQISISPTDVDDVMDWKNEEFIFKEESLSSLLRRVSRWYDVDIIYAKGIDQTQTFSGKVSRKKNISEILKALSNAGNIKFTIIRNTITVQNKK